jgi:hypothetical protein
MLALLAPIGICWAGKYDVKHNFSLKPKGNVVPQVQAVYYAHAWAQTFRPNCSDWDVEPGAGTQPVGWGPFGTDRLASQATVRHRDGGSSVPATLGRLNVGAVGLPLTTWTADATSCASAKAVANSEITVNAFGAGTAVTGTIRAHGYADAVAPPPRRSVSYAFSMAMVEARGGKLMKNGTIKWGKVVRDVVSGKTTARRQVDPIEYSVSNHVTGEVIRGTLLTVEVDIPASPYGGFIWETNNLEITASNLTFRVSLPSTNTSLQGELLIEVGGGSVTNVSATGYFAGMGPAPGATTPLNLNVPNEIEFDYDLGDFGDAELDVGLDLHGAGETAAEAESEIPWLTIRTPDDLTVTLEHYELDPAWILESSPFLLPPAAEWTKVSAPGVTNEDRVVYQVPRDPSASANFFRLRKAEGPGDTEPPTFEVIPECGGPFLMVQFNEPVFPQPLNPSHFQLSSVPPTTVQVVQVQQGSPQQVMLMLSGPLPPGPVFTLQIQGVSDFAGNVVPEGASATFTCTPPEQ